MGRMRAMTVWGVFRLLIFLGSSASLSYAQWTDNGGSLTTTDNVGIGTTNPVLALEVVGDIRLGGASGTLIVRPDSGSDPIIRWVEANVAARGILGFAAGSGDLVYRSDSSSLANGDERLRITNAGKVGIGTASPAAKLQVDGGNIRIRNSGHTYVRWTESNVTDRGILGFTQGSGDLVYRSDSGSFSNGDERFRITSTGNVGIGTASPTSKLHVAGGAKITGDLTVDGNIAAKYQDVAEWVRSPAQLAPGTVVVIDPLENNRVLPAWQPYDTRVAGVVSLQPGIILGEAGEDKAKVAHSGRVKVKVDAQYGAVSVGDLLVSSATAGYAMRSMPVEIGGISMHRPGTIVGKALEPLKNGQGEILVLLTLQ